MNVEFIGGGPLDGSIVVIRDGVMEWRNARRPERTWSELVAFLNSPGPEKYSVKYDLYVRTEFIQNGCVLFQYAGVRST